jgi:myo-inositol-1(or 4)-monophosphatase
MGDHIDLPMQKSNVNRALLFELNRVNGKNPLQTMDSSNSLQELMKAQGCAVKAAAAVGKLMRENLRSKKRINASTQYDIKLELDVRCQKVIERALQKAYPQIAILGEEGITGDIQSEERWVVDPIDGTVNFARGIPHACVSIALQVRKPKPKTGSVSNPQYETVVGVVYDPFCDELWTAIRGQPARLNGRIIKVSQRRRLDEAIVVIGFAKSRATLDLMLPFFNRVARRVQKVRMMGAAALALAYVASGRFDAYVEAGVRLWDIAAGGLILERAGGEFWHRPVAGEHTHRLIATNGLLRRQLRVGH